MDALITPSRRCLLRGRRLGLAASDRDTIVVLARRIVIFLLFGSLLLGRCLLFFLKTHDWLTAVADEIRQLVAQVLVPLLAGARQSVVRLVLLLEKGARQRANVRTVLKLCLCHLGGLLEVSVAVEELMHLVFDLCLQVEFFQ